LAPALLRRTALGIVTPSSSDTARSRLAMRFAGRFFFVGGICGAVQAPCR
jgi:hypothetical protein